MRWTVALPAVALVTVVVAGCGPGSGSAAQPVTADPAATATATGTASPAGTVVVAGRPPAALLLTGPETPGVPGAEGSYTWDGFGSDAPWIVQSEAVALGAGPWRVALDPPLQVERWTARWAPVANGVAADPEAGASGGGQVIDLPSPGSPGTWSLQLEAGFGAGRQAVWYWTVDVLP